MSNTLPFTCACGEVSGTVPLGGLHVRCYCDSCRAAEIYLGHADPGKTGISVLQVPPDQIIFDKGLDKLALMQVTPKGAYRWYASCCKTPMFSTAASPKMAYAALKNSTANNADNFGPVVAEVYLTGSDGKPKHKGIGRVVMRVASTALSAFFTGGWRNSPFFGPDQKPIAEPQIVPKDERASILARF